MTEEQNSTGSQLNQKKGHPINSASFILFTVVILMVTAAALQPLLPNDFFPYVRIGEEIVQKGAIPTTEFMTYTQFGKPVEYQYWLPSLVLMWFFKTGGVTLTSIMVIICTAAFYILLWFTLRKLGITPLLSGLLLFILGLYAASDFLPRPQLFAFPLFALSLFLIVKWQNYEDRFLWLLPIVTVFWVNLHGSFILQFFLLIPALLFGSGNRKKLLLIAFVTLFATIINAYGFGVWQSIFNVVGNESNRLFSIEFQKTINEGWQANILFATFLIIPVLTAWLKPKIQPVYWIWFVGFGWMAFSGSRYGTWYLAIVALLVGSLLTPHIKTITNSQKYFQNSKMNFFFGIFMLLIPIACLPGVRGLWWQDAPPVYSKSTPVEAVKWLKNNPQLAGEIWGNFDSCTYMTYALPQRKLFMTNRMDDFPVEQYEDYLSIFHGRYDWQNVLDEYSINLVLFDFEEQSVFMRAITESSAWDQIYIDDSFVIFKRT